MSTSKFHLPVTRATLLKPPGQKFAIGDTVRVVRKHWAHFRHEVGQVWIVEGSFAQVCRTHGGSDHKARDLTQYSIVRPETGSTTAWIDEDELELVPDGVVAAGPVRRLSGRLEP